MNSEEIVALIRIQIKAQLSLDKAKHFERHAALLMKKVELAQAQVKQLRAKVIDNGVQVIRSVAAASLNPHSKADAAAGSGKFCTSCGAGLSATSRFCERCGQPKGGASALRAPLAPIVVTCVVCGLDGQVVAAAEYSVDGDPEVDDDDDRVDASMVALFLKRPDSYESGGVKRARWEHLRYCVQCQHAWLDNTAAKPVEIVDVDTLLKG